jgi:thiazole synthase ThiGH ThiG subunit
MHPGLEPRSLPLDTAVGVIRESGSLAIFYHFPSCRTLSEIEQGADLLTPGAPSVLSIIDLLSRLPEQRRYILVANTCRAETSRDAVEMIETECQIFKHLKHIPEQTSPIVKLEVLGPDLRSVNKEVVDATEKLVSRGLTVIPMISPDLSAMKLCIELGVPAIRFLTGQIRSTNGIEELDVVRYLVKKSKVPVIFEGGIRTPYHIREAFRCGASAVLMNTAFHESEDPINLARVVRRTIDSIRNGE